MQDREFAMAKSLLTALTVRTRTSKANESSTTSSSSSKTKAKPQTSFSAANAARSARRHKFDDKTGPTPPRGSLTNEKLSYLDWRLKRINIARQKSEGTSHCWIDGRDTIGRNSIDFERCPRVVEVVPQRHDVVAVSAPAPLAARAPAPQAVAMVPSTLAAVYADEKAAGLKALEHAYAGDSVLASMPYLAKRDSSSGSELSGTSEQHSSTSEAPAAVLDATCDRDVGGVYFIRPRTSFLTRAGSRFSKKKPVATAPVPDAACQDMTESRSASRNSRSIARIWKR
ncbi:conserved hypothetical protein [Sporisorium reilianum SRZ2]|uniref:Uncharacterized protein n=1 Tax=Sporisorium reilianum (strain SRZ2) TaxID=999809 RepID=E6ZQM9_SPORE|nr:conserved hypothetical protein [Sporisorium reilianum SRZ2]